MVEDSLNQFGEVADATGYFSRRLLGFKQFLAPYRLLAARVLPLDVMPSRPHLRREGHLVQVSPQDLQESG
jgi:hypothetical protein